MAPQPVRPYSGARALLRSWAIPQTSSEDCLVLNIWTSTLRTPLKRPVMVWIHGGGYYSGSGASTVYDGTHLVERGNVVVVTLNHRLSMFGHLYLAGITDDARYADAGNVGLLDLVDALRWIRENIAEFGGDPDSVTVFGESGGGQKICCLLAMHEARGLFHRAVVQSGPCTTALSVAEASETTQRILRHLSIDNSNLSRLHELTTEQIFDASLRMPIPWIVTMGPVVDGRALGTPPFTPDAPASSADVPLLIGITRTETTYILGKDSNFAMTWDDLPAHLRGFLGGMDARRVIDEYRSILPAASASDVFFDITTQLIMARGSVAIADRKSAQRRAATYFYQLSWQLPIDGGKWRSPHAMDVPLVFNTVAAAADTMFGPMNEEAQHLADLMSEAWLAFARSGVPSTRALPAWPGYEATRRTVMDFNVSPSVLTDPFGRKLALLAQAPVWDGRAGL
jgi:para-nitrobenzyl esterase